MDKMERETDAKVVTLSFRGDDVLVYEWLAVQAEADERALSKFIVRKLRQIYEQGEKE